jgi:hypothetical protein
LTLPRFCTCFLAIVALAAFAFLFYVRETDKRLAVSNGCAAFNPKTAAFSWVYRAPDPMVPAIPIEALGPGDALGRAK